MNKPRETCGNAGSVVFGHGQETDLLKNQKQTLHLYDKQAAL